MNSIECCVPRRKFRCLRSDRLVKVVDRSVVQRWIAAREGSMGMQDAEEKPSLPPSQVTWWFRLRTPVWLLAGMRRHDLRAARTWINTRYPGASRFARYGRFLCWSLTQMTDWISITPEEVRQRSGMHVTHNAVS